MQKRCGFKPMHEIGCTRCQLLAGKVEDLRSKDIQIKEEAGKESTFCGEIWMYARVSQDFGCI